MRQARWAWLLFVGFGCAPGTGAEGLRCVSSDAVDPMKLQGKYNPYSKNTFFVDSRAMRVPPRGTVPRRLPLPSDAIATGGTDGGALQQSPIAVTLHVLAEGREAFDIHCAICHGVVGDGNSVVARKMQLRPPPSLHEQRIRNLSDGDLFRIASEGYGLMPGYSSQLDASRRWAVVSYVRALQSTRGRRIQELPERVRGAMMGGTP